MNNLFKSCKLIALLAAVIGLAACQQKESDVMDLNGKIANKTIPGIYACVFVDTVAMNTTLYEWTLTNDPQKGRIGSYRVAATGNGKDVSTETPLTWDEAKMAEDGLSMSIPVSVNGENKTLLWQDGVVKVDGYNTTKELISKVSVLRSVHENFANLDFVLMDTTFYITVAKDTTYYLAWKTQVVSYTTEQIDSAKNAMIQYHDTLLWFNATYPNRAVPDTVRFSTKAQGDGTYKGQVSVPYEDMEIKDVKTNHGPLRIINSEMVFNRDAEGKVPASFNWKEETWNEEYYTKPGTSEATHTYYYVEVTDGLWTPTAYTNIKKFNILVKGKYMLQRKHEESGTEIIDESVEKEVGSIELPLSAFNKADGEVTYKEMKYKTK